MMKRSLILSVWVILSCASVWAQEQLDTCRKVRIALQWSDQSQFAGYYMAQAKGYFAESGLDVELMPLGDESSLSSLRRGHSEFATTLLFSAYQSRRNGVNLELVTQTGYRSHMAVLAWKKPAECSDSKLILSPLDLNSKTISVFYEFRGFYELFFRQAGIQNISVVPQYRTLSLFFSKGVDACSVTLYNEYHLIYQRGISNSEVTLFPFRDYGMDFPEDGLYCLSDFARKNPQTVSAVASAVKRGWLYAKAHPEETLEEVMRIVQNRNLIANKPQMDYMLRIVLQAFPDSGVCYGKLPQESYEHMIRVIEPGIVSMPVSYETFVNENARE